jgi:hypothetical protein
MSDFSDREDRMLIQLVHQHTVFKGKQISWIGIAKKMKSRKSPEQLRLRVACLKKRFGNVLSSFPRWYFLKPLSRKLHKPNLQQLRRQREDVTSAAAAQNVVQPVSQMKYRFEQA